MILRQGNILDQIPYFNYEDLILLPSEIDGVNLKLTKNGRQLENLFPGVEAVLHSINCFGIFGIQRMNLELPSISCYPCLREISRGKFFVEWGRLGRHIDMHLPYLSSKYRTVNLDFPPMSEIYSYREPNEEGFYDVIEFLAAKLNRNNIVVWLGENGNHY